MIRGQSFFDHVLGRLVVAIFRTVLISFSRRALYRDIGKYSNLNDKIYGLFLH